MLFRHLASNCMLFALVATTHAAWSAELSDDHSIQTRFDALMQVEESSRGTSSKDRSRAITDIFATQFPLAVTSNLERLPNAEIDLVFRAGNVANFYTMSEEHLQIMESAFAELAARSLVQQRNFSDFHGALMAARDFDSARELASTYGQWTAEPAPYLDGDPANVATVMSLTKKPNHLDRTPLDIQKGTHIVVISHPLCHFSRNAVATIESDAALSRALEGAVWMTPVDRKLHLDVLHKWNAEHREHAMVIAYSRQDWPKFESWSTPTFYFLKDGKVIETVEGWPEEGRKAQILHAAAAIGR